jgi:hypothetical protein
MPKKKKDLLRSKQWPVFSDVIFLENILNRLEKTLKLKRYCAPKQSFLMKEKNENSVHA